MKNIILASQSPRRKELLARLVADFSIMPADINEEVKNQYAPVDYVEAMAEQKAALIAASHPENLVIACDTIVVLDNQILGKPVSREDAFHMIQSMSGRSHEVYTAVVLRQENHLERALTSAEVTFYPLTEKEINEYLDCGEYADKAGAYGIQGAAGVFVEKVVGDFYSIVGFPIGRVHQMLKKFE